MVEVGQGPGKVEICPVRTTDALAPVSGSRQLACGVARARQETNSDISLLCRGPAHRAQGHRPNDEVGGVYTLIQLIQEWRQSMLHRCPK